MIDSNSYVAVANMITENSTITDLRISANNICLQDAIKIAESLQFNCTLPSIKMCIDSIKIFDVVADVLESNYTLTRIFLGKCTPKISNIVARNIALHENKRFVKTKSARN